MSNQEQRKLAPARQEKPINNLWLSKAELTVAILAMLDGDDAAYFTTEVADRLRAPYSQVRNILKQLERTGTVKHKTYGTRNNQAIWWKQIQRQQSDA